MTSTSGGRAPPDGTGGGDTSDFVSFSCNAVLVNVKKYIIQCDMVPPLRHL